MSTIVNPGDKYPFFLEAGAWFTAQGGCEIFIAKGPRRIRQKIGSSQQQIGPFLSDAQIIVEATLLTTLEIYQPEAWIPQSVLAGRQGAERVGTANGETLAQRLGRNEFYTATPTNATADFIAWLATGGGTVPDGLYLIDDITITSRVSVFGSPDAIFQRRSAVAGNSVTIHFAAGSEWSEWIGPTIDGNRDALKVAHALLNPSYPGYWSGWFGMQTQAADITVKCAFKNHVSKPFWFAGDRNIIDVTCEDHGDAGLAGYLRFLSGSELPIVPRPNGRGAVGQQVRITSRRSDNAGVAAVVQHAVDVQGAKGGTYSGYVYDMGGDTAAVSTYSSGITVENCEDCLFPALVAHDFASDSLQHLGVSFLGNERCTLSQVSVKSIAGLALELNGNSDCTISMVQLDGAYRATTACPAGSDGSYGISEYAGVWNRSRNSKSSRSNVRCNILGGTVRRFTRGAYLRTGSVSLDSLDIVGNLTDGVLVDEVVFADHYTGAATQSNRLTKLTNCNIEFNGRAGISAESFRTLMLTGTRCANNGQDSTLDTNVRCGLTASTGDLLHVTASQFIDDQSWVDTATCTYAPQTSVSNLLTVYMQTTFGRLSVGQWVRLVNATGSGDVTAKVYDMGVDDDVTLQVTGSTTLASTGNTTALTGTWSGSGTTLTGTGTAATTEIKGVTYVTNGTDWRRVVKATANNSIIVDSAFSTPLSGATLSKLLVNVAGIPSQQEGLRAFGTVSKILLGPDNAYEGNVLSRMVLTDPSKCITGSAYVRKETRTINAATVNLQTQIPAGHRLVGVAANVDTAISGGGATSWELRLTDSTPTTLEVIATGVSLAKNTKVTGSTAGARQLGAGNLLRAVTSGGTPTAGVITCEARYVVEAPAALPNAL